MGGRSRCCKFRLGNVEGEGGVGRVDLAEIAVYAVNVEEVRVLVVSREIERACGGASGVEGDIGSGGGGFGE